MKAGLNHLFVMTLLAHCFMEAAQAQILFVTETGGTPNSGNIDEFAPDGTETSPPFASGLNFPYGLAFDSSGNLFVASIGTEDIYRYTPDGTQSIFASGLNDPHGLAFNSAGDLFDADYNSGSIYEFVPNGNETHTTFATGLTPYALAFNSSGDLFEADHFTGMIYEFAPNGTQSVFATGLDLPFGLAFNSAGDLFEADEGSGNIYEFTPNGTPSTFASGLRDPSDVAFDTSGNLYVTEFNGNIDEFAPDGVESPTPFASGLSNPTFLAFESVPEPSTWVMFGIGLVLLLGISLQNFTRRRPSPNDKTTLSMPPLRQDHSS
jgi:sugar lactone lactonase YvrE